MYIPRLLEKEILDNLNYYRVITIIGPRQTGKTTLVKHLFPDFPYYSAENPDTRQFISSDYRKFLNNIKDGVIIDEVQRLPELPSYIQEIVDTSDKKFILTGSNQFLIRSDISQSLAGRTSVLKLLPLSIQELKTSNLLPSEDVHDIIVKGFYPAIYDRNIPPVKAYRNYYETYVERDIRQLINIQDIDKFQLFMRLCAGRIGNLFNASSLANEVGVSVPTVKNWISILETSFIIFLLPPYHANISKRLVKSPKLYFYDVGMASYLLGIENNTHVSRDPLRGALFENMVLTEMLKSRFNKGLEANLFFYRDSNGNEVDIVIKRGNKIFPVEIKMSETFNVHFLKGLQYFTKIFGPMVENTFLLYTGKTQGKTQNTEVINIWEIDRLF